MDWKADMDKEVDLSPSFCPPQETVLLSAAWAYGMTEVGPKFVGGVGEFRDVLKKYAIRCGFEYDYNKNDKV